MQNTYRYLIENDSKLINVNINEFDELIDNLKKK